MKKEGKRVYTAKEGREGKGLSQSKKREGKGLKSEEMDLS